MKKIDDDCRGSQEVMSIQKDIHKMYYEMKDVLIHNKKHLLNYKLSDFDKIRELYELEKFTKNVRTLMCINLFNPQ